MDIRIMGDAQLMAKIKEVDQKLVDLDMEDYKVEPVEQDVDVELVDVERDKG
jgi:uncharacterized protein YaaR (DUF327 family)